MRSAARRLASSRRLASAVAREEGDVPGWVMICLMTCGLVIVIWALAGPALTSLFQHAIDRITGF